MNIDRIDIIGQNGNEGLHYEASSTLEKTVSTETIEKVQLLQNILESVKVGVRPDDEELKRAKELGIDIDSVMEVFDENDTGGS